MVLMRELIGVQQSVALAAPFDSRSGGGTLCDTVRHCAPVYVALPSGRISFKCHRLPQEVGFSMFVINCDDENYHECWGITVTCQNCYLVSRDL